MNRSDLLLFTPGPVRIPPVVARAMAEPPCNYHRQEAFREMFAETQAGLKALIGIKDADGWFATLSTATGTGANESCLLALSATGKGLIIENGFFAARLVDQAKQNGLDHVVLKQPQDRPIDPDAVDALLAKSPDIKWAYFVGHETRTGLKNPVEKIGQVCKRRGLLVGADIISGAWAYPIDLEASGLDLATASSAKALMSAPGIGIVFTRLASVPQLRAGGAPRGYYLDLVAELDKQKKEQQPRFAQPVALHAALHAACGHLRTIGIETHMRRIRSQMDELVAHLAAMDVSAQLAPEHRSWIAVNFGLPKGLEYPQFAREMEREGFYLLYGIPGDMTHFQLSTIGHLEASHVRALEAALTKVLSGALRSRPAGAHGAVA